MLELTQLDTSNGFPHPSRAMEDPNGLLAFGGDLSVERLCAAYQQGIFPWFNQGEPILWWSPDPRAIMELDDFHISRSLAKLIRKHPYRVTLNHAFRDVIYQCATVPRKQFIELPKDALYSPEAMDYDNGHTQTWITGPMQLAYQRMHAAGWAHSVEVWQGEQLVGGLYGISFGTVFCGESMFHKASNASKLAYYYLVAYMRSKQLDFIDCQLQNPFLQTLGCKEISRAQFLQRLGIASRKAAPQGTWTPTVLKE